MIYVFDTSSIIVMGHYFPDRFPTFWNNFEGAVGDGTVISVREVLKELASPREWLMDWIENHKEMFLVPGPEETKFVAKIFQVPHFQMLVTETQRLRGQPVADPFVIACASVRAGTVVTEESRKPNSARIPNVCDHFGVACTNVEGFLAQNNWQF
ncbi:MAG TPA: DUF4411 family protein [Thermoanaerobaculia bacterium]|nr:DUF4411 family protein [Thermoanaerobaculia bacterium]